MWVHLRVGGNQWEFGSMGEALDFIKWRLMRERVKRVLSLEARDFFLALFGLDQPGERSGPKAGPRNQS